MAYERMAEIYDAIYIDGLGKDYAAEAARVHDLIERYSRSGGRALLDVACGTGAHVEHLARWYDALGIDISEPMLAIARRRLPKVPFLRGDMRDFSVDQKFDAIACLFSAIGYALTVEDLRQTLATMRSHLKPGGVVLIEPWILPEKWQDRGVFSVFVDRPGLKIARMNVSTVEDRLTRMLFHFLVGTNDGVEHFTEEHVTRMFSDAEYRDAFERAGLRVDYDDAGISGIDRGLYVGVAAL